MNRLGVCCIVAISMLLGVGCGWVKDAKELDFDSETISRGYGTDTGATTTGSDSGGGSTGGNPVTDTTSGSSSSGATGATTSSSGTTTGDSTASGTGSDSGLSTTGGSSTGSNSSGSSGGEAPTGTLTAPNLQIELDEDTSTSFTLTASASDASEVFYEIVDEPGLGEAVLSDAEVMYFANADANGDDTLRYRAYTATGLEAFGLVEIAILPINDAPLTSDVFLETEEMLAVSGQLTASDVDADVIAYEIEASDDGDVDYDPFTGAFRFTPRTGFVGDVLLGFVVSDGVATDTGLISIEVLVEGGEELPPDPADVAPALSPTIATTVYNSMSFLFDADDPIQRDVVVEEMEAQRLVVLRGYTMDHWGDPLSGVRVSIKDHEEYGYTLSRADGYFDLAVNGDGQLTVVYEKRGHLTSHRQARSKWQEFVWLPDVALMQLDANENPITFGGAEAMQVAQGSVIEDEDGIRQATIFVPPGTEARMYYSSGTYTTLLQGTLRMTEYTVGEFGPQSMPASLPPTSGYTYAIELAFDEAGEDVTSTVFSQPLPFYVDNFLGFDVGDLVPLGYYDKQIAQWVPADNGVIVEVLGVVDGLAQLDITGSGTPATEYTLNLWSISENELEQVATQFSIGETFWRVLMPHFTVWDCNWPFIFPIDASGYHYGYCSAGAPAPPAGSCDANGSIVGCQDFSLKEEIPIVGTPITLRYDSRRTEGYTLERSYEVNLSHDGEQHDDLLEIEFETEVAGQKTHSGYPPEPSLQESYEWNGKDAFDRTQLGTTTAKFSVGHAFQPAPAKRVQGGRSFGANSFGRQFAATVPEGDRYEGKGRGATVVWIEKEVEFYYWPAILEKLGGWLIDKHHYYDVKSNQVYLGEGSHYSASLYGERLSIIAGGSDAITDLSPDGDVASDSPVYLPQALTFSDDGTIYYVESNLIRTIDEDGLIQTIVSDWSNISGATFSVGSVSLRDIEYGVDGYLYTTDRANHLILKIDPQSGDIFLVAGVGSLGDTISGVQATSTPLNYPDGLGIGPDGQIYFVQNGDNSVYRISNDGRLNKVAERASGPHLSIYTQPISEVAFFTPYDVAIDTIGNLYVSDASSMQVFKIMTDGTMNTFAGNANNSVSEFGTPATATSISPSYLHIGHDQLLYIVTSYPERMVVRVNEDSTLSAVIGGGTIGYTENPIGTQASAYPRDVAMKPNGQVCVAEIVFVSKFRCLQPLNENLSGSYYYIPSLSNDEIYAFDQTGKHQYTLDPLDGSVIFSFGYNSDGYLTEISDTFGNTTSIARDVNGYATSIVGPYGHTTTLSLDSNDFLGDLVDPLSQTYSFVHAENGLLTQLTYPNGGISTFAYDEKGRLAEDVGPEGRVLEMSLVQGRFDRNFKTLIDVSDGQTSTYFTEQFSDGSMRRINTFTSGLQATFFVDPEGNQTVNYADGSTMMTSLSPDSRYDMLIPLVSKTRTFPSGLAQTIERTREVELTDNADIFSIVEQVDTTSINGREYITIYDAETLAQQTISPEGRTTEQVFNEDGLVVQVQTGTLAPVFYTYNTYGQIAQVVRGEDSDARTTVFTYDELGRLATITDPLGRSSSFDYDSGDRLIMRTLPDAHEIDYTYDLMGNLTSLTPPSKPAHEFDYTLTNLESVYSPPDAGLSSFETEYEYDLDHKIVQQVHPDGQVVNYTYDHAQRLLEVDAPSHTIRYGYDEDYGQRTSIEIIDGIGLEYTFDGSLLTGTTWTGEIAGVVSRTYDENLWVVARSVNGTEIEFDYDDDGMLITAGDLSLIYDNNGLLTDTVIGSLTDSYEYNSFAEMTSYSAELSSTSLFEQSFTRDALGRIVEKVETTSTGTVTYGYEYDTTGRLIEVTQDSTVISTYTYDENGNRLTHVLSLGTAVGTYDDQDRLLTYGGISYTYNNNGDLTSKTESSQTTTYDYDVFGNLREVVLPDETIIEYIIDGKNRRVGKKVDGSLTTGWLYKDQLNPIAQLDSTGAVEIRFVYGSKYHVPDYMVKSGTTYRIVSDHLGSVRQVVNVDTGTIVQELIYDEFGNVTSDTNPGFQPFGFAGGLYDTQTELVRFGARDYDAEIGRWTSKDPVRFRGGDENLYGYVSSDPINYIDITGEFLIGCVPKPEDESDEDDDSPEEEEEEEDKCPGGTSAECAKRCIVPFPPGKKSNGGNLFSADACRAGCILDCPS